MDHGVYNITQPLKIYLDQQYTDFFKLATYLDFTTASEILFQTSTILQLKIFPNITMAARLNKVKAITTC